MITTYRQYLWNMFHYKYESQTKKSTYKINCGNVINSHVEQTELNLDLNEIFALVMGL